MFEIQGVEVKQDQNELVNLTDIWKASNMGQEKKPVHWRAYVGESFIGALSQKVGFPTFKIWETTRGRNGGTFAHWQIALDYAKWLSPELHMEVNETYLRAKSGDVTLADEIADKASPEDQKWLKKRVDGKVARNQLTSILKEHGVHRFGYALCTDQINLGLFDKTSKEIRADRGIKKHEVRNSMNHEELAAIELAEIVAARKIADGEIQGTSRCAKTCGQVASNIRMAIA